VDPPYSVLPSPFDIGIPPLEQSWINHGAYVSVETGLLTKYKL